eukprot:scpid77540/ scgid24339/ 
MWKLLLCRECASPVFFKRKLAPESKQRTRSLGTLDGRPCRDCVRRTNLNSLPADSGSENTAVLRTPYQQIVEISTCNPGEEVIVTAIFFTDTRLCVQLFMVLVHCGSPITWARDVNMDTGKTYLVRLSRLQLASPMEITIASVAGES